MLNLNSFKRLACQASLGALLVAAPALGQVCTCPGDMNYDGLIDGADLGALLGEWGSNDEGADLNHDGNVDGADLGAMLGQWGPCGTPMNDNCSGAVNITEGSHPFCTLHATTDGPSWAGITGCQSGATNMVKDIWFRYTATSTGTLTVSTCDAADYDTIIAVYGFNAPGVVTCPTPGNFTLLGCDDDDYAHCSAETSLVTINVTVGYTYLIRLGGWSTGGTGHLTVAPGTPGSSCINPVTTEMQLGFPYQVVEGSTVGNPIDYSYSQSCFQQGYPGGPTEWVRWVAPCNGTVMATTCMDGTTFDTVLTVLHANPGESCWSSLVTCNDDSTQVGCDIQGFNWKSRVEFPVQANHVYMFAVSGWGGDSGNYELFINRTCP